MPRVLIGFIHGIVRVLRDRFRFVLECPPEVRHKAIKIVDGFGRRRVRPIQQYSAGAEERLDVVLDVAESIPDQFSNARLTTEPRERGF